MKNVLKFTVAFGAGLMLMTGCSLHTQDNAQKRVEQKQENNIQTYFGIIPCASCPGIKTWIRIDESGKYTQVEEYLEEKDAIFINDGKLIKKSNSVFALKSQNHEGHITFRKNQLCMLNSNKTINQQYCLDKLDEFHSSKQAIFIAPKTLSKNHGKIAFSGVVNLKKKANSISSNFIIDCKSNKIKLSNTKYFKGTYAIGQQISKDKLLKIQNASLNTLFEKDLLYKIKKTYCCN